MRTKKTKNPNFVDPQTRIENILKEYQSGDFKKAEKIAKKFVNDFPQHPFGWKALASIQKNIGKNVEAIVASKASIELAPNDPETHFNLGNTLKELQRYNEAVESYSNAISLKPDYAKALNNLGNTLEILERIKDAEICYRKAIEAENSYADAYNNLGTVLKKQKKFHDAANHCFLAIKLNPHFAEPYVNLGLIFNDEGQFEKAEKFYQIAINLQPKSRDIWLNYGNTLKNLGRFLDAEASYRNALRLSSDNADAYSNLGVVLIKLKRIKEAEKCFKKALLLQPKHAECHYNTANLYREKGLLEDALNHYKCAMQFRLNYAAAYLNAAITVGYMDDPQGQLILFEKLKQIDDNSYGLRATVGLAICHFLSFDFAKSRDHLKKSLEIEETQSLKLKNEKIYHRYLSKILDWHTNEVIARPATKEVKPLYVIGESHSLSYHGIIISLLGKEYRCKAHLIQGCKQWHLASAKKNQFKFQFKKIFKKLPKHSEVIITIGEIDCRLDDGIMRYFSKNPNVSLQKIITNTIENFLNFILGLNSQYKHQIVIQGVPCPVIDELKLSKLRIEQLIEVISAFNKILKLESLDKGFGFLDVHTLTNNGDGLSNNTWHIDDIHLSGHGVMTACEDHFFIKH